MTTLAHEVTRYIATEWEKMYASAVFSGIVGDPAHQARGGYHISIQDQSITNYSVIRPDDKAPPGDWPRNLAAAIDMSMSPTDMATCSGRLWNVWNDKTDPRRNYLNGFNGWFNDGGPAKRYDFVTQGISTTTSDHKWHVHAEERRMWVTSMVAASAILSILRGESKAQYLANLQGVIEDMYAKHGMGVNGAPISHDTMYMQGQMRFLVENTPELAARLEAHPLTVDGKYGDQTDYWVSVIITGRAGTEVNGQGFKQLNDMVIDAKIQLAMAALPAPPELPDSVDVTFPAFTIPVPATTVTVQIQK